MSFDEAGLYNKMSSLEQEEGLELIKMLAPEKGSKVLDLGCGTGFLSKALADEVGPEGSVVAIDPDTSRLQVARSTHASSNLQFTEGRAESIPGNGYDIVFSNHVLHWCEDKTKAFQEVTNCLKPGGKFGFSCVVKTPEGLQIEQLSARMQKVLHESLYPLDDTELDHCISSMNLKELYRNTHECVHKFSSFSEYRKFFHVHTLQRQVSAEEIDAPRVEQKPLCFKYPVLTSILVKE